MGSFTDNAAKTTARTSARVIKQRVVGGEILAPETDDLAIEDPLEMTLSYRWKNQVVEKRFNVTMRTPGLDDELIHGFLFCEGVILRAADIVEISYNKPVAGEAPTQAKIVLRDGLDGSAASIERNFATHSSCGVCGTTRLGHLSIPKSLKMEEGWRISAPLIHGLPDLMRSRQATFDRTGGLHAAALFAADGGIFASCEDIGRHNALDKVIGTRLMSGEVADGPHVLCVSGRMSYEILQKALVARIPVIAGVGAPSSLAVMIANDFNLTLIGFVRDGSYNIYSCPERIIIP